MVSIPLNSDWSEPGKKKGLLPYPQVSTFPSPGHLDDCNNNWNLPRIAVSHGELQSNCN